MSGVDNDELKRYCWFPAYCLATTDLPLLILQKIKINRLDRGVFSLCLFEVMQVK